MPLDSILFLSEAFEVANEYNAALEDESADGYREKLYQEYLGIAEEISNPPEGEERANDRTHREKNEANRWLKERLRDTFRWIDEEPRWIESEPGWLFHEDEPMVFISQTKMRGNKLAKELLMADREVYLFGIRVTEGKSTYLEHDLLIQYY